MITAAEADVDSDGLEESELLGLTITQLRGLAADSGYELTKTKKADIIEEILAAGLELFGLLFGDALDGADREDVVGARFLDADLALEDVDRICEIILSCKK